MKIYLINLTPNLKIYNSKKYKENMTKNLLKIAGIVLLSTIPKNLSEYNIPYSNCINLPKTIEITETKTTTKENNINSVEIQDINSEIELLNQKKDFFSRRIREYDSLALIKGYDSTSEIRKSYEKNLNATERKIREYKRQKKSLKN
jgi:hypothetical protein